MTEWDVVKAVVVLVGLFFTIGKPVLSLNSSITELNLLVSSLRTDFSKLDKENQDEHKELQKKDAEQDVKLNGLEYRVSSLERE